MMTTSHWVMFNDCNFILTASDKSNIEENAEILLADTPVIIDLAGKAKKLKWAASTWAGVERLIKEIGKEKPPGFTITRMGGAYSRVMGEYVLGYILTKERFIIEVAKDQETQSWNNLKHRNYRNLAELTIGILGVGDIGQEVARLCNAVGMTVIGVTRTKPAEEKKSQAVSQYRLMSELPSVLKDCDYVCNILPSTPETRGTLSGDILSHCKNKKSIFINIGRGDIIDEQSLITALKEGWIGGAVLDVFQKEPLPKESPLWSLPGVVITPHIAGATQANLVASSFVDNYKLFIENKPLKYQVDFQQGY
ncbi:glyoxylate/hydroxypyruvate reductase A-like [Ruditapes philippinarum]|uniref:glyoxylate/hydroxypyruvate reductase A-like n=1 Tax=Ruditapes philippinarum TaxID=129788 RepID=UPI00295AD55C|nr:glyoxylate/hydroxypyruvate reductase A-like [Ruditapes philippinarum]